MFNRVDVRGFIQKHYTPYIGDESFLCGPSDKTRALLKRIEALLKDEAQNGRPWVDCHRISGIMSFPVGYIDRQNEVIVGLQTDEPLKRMINPYGGIKMVEDALSAYGYEMSEDLMHQTKHIRTHNEGVFAAYTDDMRRARSSGLLSGLPDAYGRGRIIGDYRRVALYGVDKLIELKVKDLKKCGENPDDLDYTLEEIIELRELLAKQISALKDLKSMAALYHYAIDLPAKNAYEAVQHLYFAYLAGVKENNGAAMSLGRVSTFLDIYIEKDISQGVLTEMGAQELIDQLVLKLRLVRHLRTPEYDELFAGDPNWVTEALGGMGLNGKTLVTKTTFRFMHTLNNLGASPEPNMTVLWSQALPEPFKLFCTTLSVDTSALQFENDDLMRKDYGDDYGIACCVSAMKLGQDMQYFGARCNLPKVLLYALNGGIDEISGKLVLEGVPIAYKEGEPLDYTQVKTSFFTLMTRVAKLYVHTMNTIHFMHDKYAYEASLMALHDTELSRMMAFGIAGLSIVADSLSAIKYADVYPILKDGRIVDFKVSGTFPMYGNDDDRVDQLAVEVVKHFSDSLKQTKTYKKAKHTLSVLTITSNVVYGKKTGSTPDGRKAYEPFAPGANPLHGREEKGALASMNSVAKIPYRDVAEDGISYTFSVVPSALGKSGKDRGFILSALIDGYFLSGGHHINVNVLDRSLLEAAMAAPQEYPNLTIRVSGYAVHFHKLTREQQLEVISRCYHSAVGGFIH